MTENILPVNNPNDISLDKHIFIEASAGTGKTYTIQKLVSRLLEEGKVSEIENILIVTFTEKAAGELRFRIRNEIIERAEKNHSLNYFIENFEKSSIHTIHGFCKKILQQYPFETGVSSEMELISENELIETALESVLNTLEQSSLLFDFMTYAGISKSQRKKNRLIKEISSVIISISSDIDPIVYPQPSKNYIEKIKRIDSAFRTTLSNITISVEEETIQKRSLPKFKRVVVEPLRKIVDKVSGRKEVFADIMVFIESVKKEYTIAESAELEKVLLKEYKENPGAGFSQLLHHLDGLFHCCPDDIAGSMKIFLVMETIEEMKRIRERESSFTFNSMLFDVNQGITMEKSTLPDILRQKYRYVLVDEFQDTDPLQWNIFKTLFLNDQTRLALIGDPKQAIYSFRGADIYTYFQAKEDLLGRANGAIYSLDTNWRSSPPLIGALNKLFRKNWFSNEIEYRDSLSPVTDKDFTERIESYPEEKSPVEFILCAKTKQYELKAELSEIIASEVVSLVSAKKYKLKEIAILVETKENWFVPITREFEKRHIPYTIYKREGLFNSQESESIVYLLSAMRDVHHESSVKELLLSEIFSVSLEDLSQSLIENHEMLLHWSILADEKRWSFFFKEVRSFIDSQRDLNHPAYRFILDTLEQKAVLEDMSTVKMLQWLLKQSLVPISNEDFIPADHENAVSILSMHASKGLEFPVVFAAGGFTRYTRPDIQIYHKDKKRVYDITQSEESNILTEEERKMEKERLFYVTFTRAISKLYIPYNPEIRSYINSKISSFCESNNITPLTADDIITEDTLDEIIFPSEEEAGEQSSTSKDKIPSFNRRITPVTSFSTIAMKNEVYIDTGQFDEEHQENPITDLILPAGSESGTLVHNILEEMINQRIDPRHGEELHTLVSAHVTETFKNSGRNSSAITEVVMEMVTLALTLPYVKNNISLCDIEHKTTELEFYSTIHDITIHGFIDLIFHHEGKYYILDWKTNFINGQYNRENMEENMLSHRYNLQYALYTKALANWLEEKDPDFSFEKSLGGIYYVYLRGLVKDDTESGIYFFRPSSEDEIDDIIEEFL